MARLGKVELTVERWAMNPWDASQYVDEKRPRTLYFHGDIHVYAEDHIPEGGPKVGREE